MDSRELMKQIFKYIDRNDLVLTSDKYAHRIRRGDDLGTNSITSSQVVSGHEMSDGKRLMIVSYNGLTDDITKLFDREGLVYAVSDDSPTSIYVYPNAKKDLLGIQTQPTSGNVQIIQGEYAITNSNDPNPILSTFAIASCVGLLLFDPKLRLGSVAHVDYSHEVTPTLKKMIGALDRSGANELIFGRTSNIDPQTEQYGILSKYGQRFSESVELPREFSFDTKTGNVGQYIEADDLTFERRLNDKTDHRLEEHITMCFPVYTAK